MTEGEATVLVEIEESVATIRLNRPKARNAINDQMITEFSAALRRVDRDDSARVVIVTGSGGSFCAGGDVSGLRARAQQDATDTVEDRRRILIARQRATAGALYRLSKPTIAVIDGPVAGAGLALALACDIRMATTRSSLITAYGTVGLSGDYGTTWLLTQLIGPSLTKELLYFSDSITAQQAKELGLVNRVFVAEQLWVGTQSRVAQLLTKSDLALRAMKANVDRAVLSDLDSSVVAEAGNHALTSFSDDHRRLVTELAKRRRPCRTGVDSVPRSVRGAGDPS